MKALRGPLLGVAALAALGALLALAWRQESVARRDRLELAVHEFAAALSFHVRNEIEALRQELAHAEGGTEFEQHAQVLLREHWHLSSLYRFDDEGGLLAAWPQPPWSPVPPELLASARRRGGPVYSALHDLVGGGPGVDVAVAQPGRPNGTLVTRIDLRRLLAHVGARSGESHAPVLVDPAGVVLGGEPGPVGALASRPLPFGVPGVLVQTREIADPGRRALLQLGLVSLGLTGLLLFSLRRASQEIEARQRSEASLRESEALFRHNADFAPVLIWMAGLDKGCTWFNKPWLDFTGRTLEQEQGNGWAEGVHPDDFERCLKIYTSHFDARQPFAMEYRLRNAVGEYRWVLDNGVPRHDAAGTFLGFIGSCIDVTARRASEQALRESEQRYRRLVDLLPDAVLIQVEGRVMFANPAAARLLRAPSADDLCGREIVSFLDPADLSIRAERIAAMKRGVETVPWQAYRLRRLDGTRVPAEVSGSRLVHAGQDAVLLVVRDLSEREQAEQALAESERSLAALVEKLERSNEQLESVALMQARFIRGEGAPATFRDLLDALLKLTGSAFGFIGEVSTTADGRPILLSRALSNLAWDEATRQVFESVNRGEPAGFTNMNTLFGPVVLAGETVVANDALHDPRRGGLPPGPPPIHAFLGLPICQAGQVIGMAGLGNRPGGYDADVIEGLAPFLATAGTLIGAHRAQRLQAEAEAEAARALQRAQEFETLFRVSNAGSAIVDFEGRLLAASPALAQGLGRDEAALVGASALDLAWEADRARLKEALERSLAEGGTPLRLTLRYRKRDGVIGWAAVEARPDLQARRHYFVAIDITDRVHADEALRVRDAALEAAATAVMLCERDGTIIWVNSAFTTLTGYGADEVLGHKPSMLRSSEQADVAYRDMWDEILRGETWHGEIVNRRRDGTTYHEEQTVTPVRDAAGKVTHFIGMKQDVTWRHETQERLRTSEARHRGLVQGLEAIVWEADAASFRFTFVSDYAETLLGYPKSAWIEDPSFWADHIHPQDREWATGFCVAETRARRGHAFDYRMIAADGRIVWLHDVVRVVESPEGGLVLTGVMIDITRHRELEAAVREAATEWTTTFDALKAAMIVLDDDGRVLRLNEAARRMCGTGFAECTGRSFAELGAGEPWHAAADAIREARTTSGRPVERRGVDAGEAVWDVEAFSVPTGRGTRSVVGLRDVTAVERLRESVRRAETMAAMGSLIAGVAHEVRNPLFAMSVNIDALAAEVGETAEISELVEALRHERNRINTLMNDLLQYGRPLPRALVARRLRPVLEAALAHCRVLADKLGVSVALEPGPDAPVLMDEARLTEVFDNLYENACQHTPRGGEVVASLALFESEAAPWVRCTVRDSGPGLSDEVRARLFEPFFTRRRGGTGLGLAIAQRIVTELGGRIAAHNAPSGGAVLTVELPVVGAPAQS